VGFYSRYKGRGCGRILGYLEKYCGLHVAEEAIVYDNKVTYWGETIATYTWDGDSDVATFIFNPNLNKSIFYPKYWTRNQRIYKPYIDLDQWDRSNPLNCGNYEFILQEIRNKMEYLGLPLTRNEIVSIIDEYSFGYWSLSDFDIEYVVKMIDEVGEALYKIMEERGTPIPRDKFDRIMRFEKLCYDLKRKWKDNEGFFEIYLTSKMWNRLAQEKQEEVLAEMEMDLNGS